LRAPLRGIAHISARRCALRANIKPARACASDGVIARRAVSARGSDVFAWRMAALSNSAIWHHRSIAFTAAAGIIYRGMGGGVWRAGIAAAKHRTLRGAPAGGIASLAVAPATVGANNLWSRSIAAPQVETGG
jgi:hypothetical protein